MHSNNDRKENNHDVPTTGSQWGSLCGNHRRPASLVNITSSSDAAQESTSLAGEWVGTVGVGRELQPVSVTFTAGDSPDWNYNVAGYPVALLSRSAR